MSSGALEQLRFVQYDHSLESQYLQAIRVLIAKDLSEPYSIYVYRFFLNTWPHLCYLALLPDDSLVGVVICKLEHHTGRMQYTLRGYIGMLAVDCAYRGQGIATALVRRAIDALIRANADEIALETEESNKLAMRLYERLGFIRTKKLHRHYLNGSNAYRLVLLLRPIQADPGDSLQPLPLPVGSSLDDDAYA